MVGILCNASLNEIILRSLESTRISCNLEPSVVLGQMARGQMVHASLVPYRGTKVRLCDATRPDTLAPSPVSLSVRWREPAAVTASAGQKKTLKYKYLPSSSS